MKEDVSPKTTSLIKCEDCVNSLFGTCQFSYHNAACLYSAKDWHDVTLSSLEEYAKRMKNYYEERYKMHVRQIDHVMEKVRRENNGRC